MGEAAETAETEAVRAALGAERIVAGDIVVDPDAGTATRAGITLELTPKELAVLVAFCRRPNRVLSRAYLQQAVWGYSDMCGLNVVEVHVCALRRKLERYGPRVIHTVRNVGYRLERDAGA